jgi:hypothetical protein
MKNIPGYVFPQPPLARKCDSIKKDKTLKRDLIQRKINEKPELARGLHSRKPNLKANTRQGSLIL